MTLSLQLAGNAVWGEDGITFRNFSGVCHGKMKYDLLWTDSIGWIREDFKWNKLMPSPGKWDEKAFTAYCEQIMEAKKKGVTMLPIIAYSAVWAGENPPESVICGNIKTEYRRQNDGRGYELLRYRKKNSVNGEAWDLYDRRKVSTEKVQSRWLAADRQGDWEDFVRTLVSRLRQPPYSIEYFQIWNEPWPTSGFWVGDMDTFMTRVHLPAAKIIRELGGKVVYGGWICGAPIEEAVNYFDRHQAWSSIDVLDLHYFPLAAQEYLYREMVKRQLDIGIWQAEIGFGSDPNLVGNLYPRLLHWSLSRNWSYPDKYKYFYFCYQSPDKPEAYGYRRTLVSGGRLSDKGNSLRVLGELFSGGSVAIYQDVTSSPALRPEIDERLSSMECFRVGKKIICAVHLLENNNAKIFVDWNGDGNTIHLDHGEPEIRLTFPKILPEQVASLERVGIFGHKVDIMPEMSGSADGSGCQVTVPVREPNRQEFSYTDMSEKPVPQVFYLVLTLK